MCSSDLNRRRMPMRRCRRCFTTIRPKVIWSGEISGTCVRPAHQSRRDGAARYCMCGLPSLAAAVSCSIRKSLGTSGQSLVRSHGACRDAAKRNPEIASAAEKAMHRPDAVETLQKQGFEPLGQGPDAFKRYLLSEITRRSEVARHAGVRS